MATNIEIKRYSSGVWGTVYPKANWNNMDNKPSTFTPSSHTHSQYLEKTGGIVTGHLGFRQPNATITRFEYVENGLYSPGGSPATGMILITLPESDSRMFKMKVSIYNYVTGTSCEFALGGYPYLNGQWYNPFVYALGNGSFSALPVRFYSRDSNNRFKIGIGNINTKWDYPQIFIKDVEIGFNSADSWRYGWSISLVTTAPTESALIYENNGYLPVAGGNIGSGGTTDSDSVNSPILRVKGGRIKIENFGKYLEIGSSNGSYAHFSTNATFYFNNPIQIAGYIAPYENNLYVLGTNNNKWKEVHATTIYENGTSLASKYQAIGNYLTSHQDISGKADKASITAGWYRRVQVNAQGIVIGGDQTDANDDTNTWRKVQLNGVDKLGNGISTNPLNIKAGSNVTITESSGTFTFAATDTTYESKAAASGGTAVSLVTTGEKYTWNNKANSSHTHSSITTVGDNRSVATKPSDYGNKIIFQGLKYGTTIGSPSSDTYSYLIGLRGWADSSGGNAHELAFNDTGIYIRNGATTTWGNWKKLATISDVNNAIQTAIGDAIAASY